MENGLQNKANKKMSKYPSNITFFYFSIAHTVVSVAQLINEL